MKKHKLIGRKCRMNAPTIFGWKGVGTIMGVEYTRFGLALKVQRDDTGGLVECMRHEVSVIRRPSISSDALILRHVKDWPDDGPHP